MSRTFAAISTARMNAAIGVVRMSGPESIAVAQRVFFAADGSALCEKAGGAVTYGRIADAGGKTVDRVLAAVFRAPASFTGEDTVEFYAHGGVVVLGMILTLLLENGAEYAEAGEFAKTAFLNGKIDLVQSEAIIDLINAESEAAARLAAQGASPVSKAARELREELVAALSEIGASADFYYEQIEPPDEQELAGRLSRVQGELEKLAGTYRYATAVVSGIETAIVGRPNVGKSSVMNMLCGEGRSIVADLCGTTRDVVKEKIKLGDIMLSLSDTAGIRDGADEIEKLGALRALEQLEKSELVLFVIDGSQPLFPGDLEIAKRLKGRGAIAVANKADKGLEPETLGFIKDNFECVVTSAKLGEGRAELCGAIEKRARAGADLSCPIVANARQHGLIVKAKAALSEAVLALRQGEHADVVDILIDEAAQALSEITGGSVRQDVVADIFSRFCVGK